MKTIAARIIATTLLATASIGAFAQTISPADAARANASMNASDQYPAVPFQSTKTRAQVQQELIAAERAGTIANGDNYPILAQPTSHKTRAQVLQELAQAEHDGTLTRGDDYPVIQPLTSHKTRAQVEAELVAAKHVASNDTLYNGS